MLSLSRVQKGFTIIELLIVIVIIGILAGLGVNAYTGVLARGRDTERVTDISNLARQLEVYYTDNSGYPLMTGNLNTDSWVQTNIKGLDVTTTLRAPGATANSIITSTTPTKSQYGYSPLQSDGTTACTTAPCAKFKLYYLEENTNSVKSKDSVN